MQLGDWMAFQLYTDDSSFPNQLTLGYKIVHEMLGISCKEIENNEVFFSSKT